MSFHRTRPRVGCSMLAVVGLATIAAGPVFAQESVDPVPGTITITGGFEVLNQYMFRGVRQNDTEIVMWPFADLGIAAFSGDGVLKRVGVNVGVWNSLHTGDTGSGGPSGELWYESNLYATLGVRLGGGVSLGTTYTAYTSPNDMFATVKELSVRAGLDDTGVLGRAAVRPYVLAAFELDARPGVGQVDGGLHAGKFLELGVAPGYAIRRSSVAFPVKLGVSLDDYYELAGQDHRFGFFSVGSTVTVPIVRGVNLRGGVEYLALGTTTRAFNGGDGSRVVGRIGLGVAY